MQVLVLVVVMRASERRWLYHMLGSTTAPFGMKYPLYVLSSEVVWGMPIITVVYE